MSALPERIARPLALASLAVSSSGCRVVGGIFKAGVWVGIIAAFAIIALAFWAMRSASR
jgi:hypothetical protein